MTSIEIGRVKRRPTKTSKVPSRFGVPWIELVGEVASDGLWLFGHFVLELQSDLSLYQQPKRRRRGIL